MSVFPPETRVNLQPAGLDCCWKCSALSVFQPVTNFVTTFPASDSAVHSLMNVDHRIQQNTAI